MALRNTGGLGKCLATVAAAVMGHSDGERFMRCQVENHGENLAQQAAWIEAHGLRILDFESLATWAYKNIEIVVKHSS